MFAYLRRKLILFFYLILSISEAVMCNEYSMDGEESTGLRNEETSLQFHTASGMIPFCLLDPDCLLAYFCLSQLTLRTSRMNDYLFSLFVCLFVKIF